MANPQDKTKKGPLTPGAATGSPTGSEQPKGAETNRTPSSGHDVNQSSMTNPGMNRTGASSTSTGNSPSMSAQNTSGDQPLSEKVSDTASGILDKAKETASGTYDAVATQATNKIEERKGELSTGLRTLADSFRKAGTDLRQAPETTSLTDMTAQYSGTAANQIDKVANYFERKDLKAMMRDTESFARRNPAIFLGAAFALGMLAARFLKSSAPDDRNSMNAGSIHTSMPTALPSAGSTGTGAPRNA